MIKILFLIPGLSEGGAEKVLRNLVNNMDQTKFKITVQTIDTYDARKYLKEGICYKSINPCRTNLGKKIFSYWFRLCAELKLAYRFYVKDDYDIEIAYLETAATKIIAQSTNKKAVKLAWVHCDLSKKEGMGASVDKVREQYKKFDNVICVSEDVRVGFYKLCGSEFDAVVLPNVIDEEEILVKADETIEWEQKSGEVQLLAIGRLAQEKNFSYLINTCEKLRNADFQFHLNILGEGPERKNLEKQIRELKLETVITLKGFISNPYPWMRKADIIVCSSQYEGISTVVQEAMILGKAVVTTPCTGMKELLGESEYGLIVQSSDDGLYQGLKQMILSPSDISSYGERAKIRSMAYSKKEVVCYTQNYLIDVVKR